MVRSCQPVHPDLPRSVGAPTGETRLAGFRFQGGVDEGKACQPEGLGPELASGLDRRDPSTHHCTRLKGGNVHVQCCRERSVRRGRSSRTIGRHVSLFTREMSTDGADCGGFAQVEVGRHRQAGHNAERLVKRHAATRCELGSPLGAAGGLASSSCTFSQVAGAPEVVLGRVVFRSGGGRSARSGRRGHHGGSCRSLRRVRRTDARSLR